MLSLLLRPWPWRCRRCSTADGGQANTAACGWDGGDCCSSTCNSTVNFGCGHYTPYVCLDPMATNDICNVGVLSYVGDGVCDLVGHYNTLACGWDGGDCCPDTCGSSCTKYTLACKDPDSDDYGYVTCAGAASWLGDGICDSSTGENTAACGWDGGDCCPDTCDCGNSCNQDCGSFPYACMDPDSTSFDDCGA